MNAGARMDALSVSYVKKYKWGALGDNLLVAEDGEDTIIMYWPDSMPYTRGAVLLEVKDGKIIGPYKEPERASRFCLAHTHRRWRNKKWR